MGKVSKTIMGWKNHFLKLLNPKSTIQNPKLIFCVVARSKVNIRCAAEILDDFIPTSRQNVDMFVGVREIFK